MQSSHHPKTQTTKKTTQSLHHHPEKKIEPSALEKLIDAFQSAKTKFTQFIQNHLAQTVSSKRTSEDQNYHRNEQSNQDDTGLLQYLEQTIPMKEPKFHFDREETQVILQEALILCSSMIEQYESNQSAKKSRTIKKTLTKSLLFLNRFLVKNIVPSGQIKISWILNQANFILLQGGSPSDVKNKKGAKGKREIPKSHQFEVPLLITNSKIPFSFYFIFSVLQQKYLKNQPKNEKQILKELDSEVYENCQDIMLNNQNNEAKNLLVKAVCDSFGSFEFPVTYIFLTSIVGILEAEIREKYNSLNTETLHPLRLNRELFSLKNIEIIFQALIKHEANSFNKFQITLIEKDQNQSGSQTNTCEDCSGSFEVMILVELAKNFLKKERKHIKGQTGKSQIRKMQCPYCFTAQEKFSLAKLQQSNFQNEKVSFLMRLLNESFWRQNFDLKIFEDSKSMNKNLLFLTGRCNHNDIQSSEIYYSKEMVTQMNETQITALTLRTLFLNENPGKSSSQTKKRSLIGLASLKQKIMKFFLIFLNSQSEAIRMETIETLSTQYFMSYLSQNFEDSEILRIIQSSAEDNKNLHEQGIINSRQTVKLSVQKLLFQVKNRLFDSCPSIQTNSMSFLLKLRSFYPNSRLKVDIFEFITQIFEQKLLSNRLKQIPMEIIRMLFNEIESQCNFDNKNRAADIITAKHLINKCLQLSFTFFDFHAKSGGTQFHGDHVWQLVLMVRQLIERMLWLVEEQKKQMKTNFKKLQYENFVVCYLKEFRFTKTTINCFVFNDELLQKLISMTQLDHDENQQDEVEIDRKQSRLLDNLKLILEELFEFNKEILKNPAVAKSMQKKTKENGKKSKQNKKVFNLKNSDSSFEFKSPSCNLNKIIKNIIRKEKKLSILDCEILFLLLQKNILLNYESQSNFTDTPSKIKRLILSLQTTTKFNEILNFIEKQIKECGMDSLPIYIKLYVVICIQINQEKKIESLFVFYKNAYKFFKKSWLNYYKNYRNNDDQDSEREKDQSKVKNEQFFIRSLKTTAFLATEFEKFKKIQCITQTGFSEVKRPNVNDYSIFSPQTQQAINALDTYPQACFVELYQQIYDLLNMFVDKDQKVPKKYSSFIKICLQTLSTITNIHPHLLIKINSNLKYLPIQMKLDYQCQACYLSIFENIISAKDPVLTGLLSKTYDNVGYYILLQNQNLSRQKYQNLERFYKVTFYLLKEDLISIRQAAKTVFYGLFTKNKKINDWTKEYLDYINEKGDDLNLFSDFKKSIEWIASKLKSIDKYFSQDKEFFRNVTYLTQINKQRNKKMKVLLQKEIRQVSIRSTFIKKVAQIFGGDFDWLKYTDDQKECCIILLLKIIQEQTQMDVYELQELVSALEKIIREYNFAIVRTVDYIGDPEQTKYTSEDDETNQAEISDEQDFDSEDDNLWMICQRRRMIFLVGQIMYTLIKLLNEKKLRTVTKDIEKLIDSKKFNSTTINFPVNTLPVETGQRQVALNYADCLSFIKQLNSLLQGPSEEFSNIMNLTKQFKELAAKMYSIIFDDQKPRIYVNPQKPRNKKQKKRRLSNDSDDENDEDYSDFSQTEYTNSRQSSVESHNNHSRSKETKKFGLSSAIISKSNENSTKKANTTGKSRKGLSNSLPKKIEKRLMTIGQMSNDEEHVMWGDKGMIRSKRAMDKEEKKKIPSEKIKQI